MKSSVKATASKQRIQQVATTAVAASEVDASVTVAALTGPECLGLNIQRDLFPQDGALPSDPSVISLKVPYCSESARASLTASASDSASYRGSGGGRVSLSGHQFHEQSRGLIPHNVYFLSSRL